MNKLLPAGVSLRSLQMNRDDRGVFTEIFRESFVESFQPVQWNFVHSEANVLRGLHVHIHHYDYLVALGGQVFVALRDLRKGSSTEGLVTELELSGEELQALTIPPGVLHGFYFSTPSTHLYGVSKYWDIHDELGCQFDDPELGIQWPTTTPLRSERDQRLSSLADLLKKLPSWQEIEAENQKAAAAK